MTDVDGLHGSFLTIDENGQRLFVITSKDDTAQNDINTLTVVTPALPAGTQRVTIKNPDGEAISLDAAFLANWF
jgi:hypothetical protein